MARYHQLSLSIVWMESASKFEFDEVSEASYTEVETAMTVTLKPKTEITVPKSIRRKAGIKPGDRFEFSVTGRTISITPKLSPDELQDEREIRDPKIRATIRKGYQEFLDGKSRPAKELLSELTAAASSKTSGRIAKK